MIPEPYEGREQAFLKHKILKSYLEAFFMILGRNPKVTVLNYVDCLAGPWSESSQDLSDTSIGVSMAAMKSSADALEKTFGTRVKFRALYVEKNPESFQKLQRYLNQNSDQAVEATALEGRYQEHIPAIKRWAGRDFTFFFIDPKGWKGVVNADLLEPLLKHPNSEFLINLMFEFVNRFASKEDLQADVQELLGPDFSISENQSTAERERHILTSYQNQLASTYGGKVAAARVMRPSKNRTLYYLVYLTRNPLGIIKFMEHAEAMEETQRVLKAELKFKSQMEKGQITDMFAESTDPESFAEVVDNESLAREFLIHEFSSGPLTVDRETWANFLIRSELFPGDLQKAAKQLLSEGRLVNLSADASRRYKKPFNCEKNERWRLS